MKNFNVFGYARKSPDDNEETNTSINNQIEMIKNTCENNNWNLIDVFIDSNISGRDRDRKAFNKMISRFFSEDVNIIVVKDQDRFSRDLSLFRDKLIDIEARRKKVYSILKGDFLYSYDLGDTVKAVIDDNYIHVQKIKAAALFEQKKDNGLPVFRSPFGYKNDKKTKTYKIDKRKASVVVDVINSYLDNINYRDIINKNKINKNQYYRIIENTKNGIYSGYIYYKKKRKDSKNKVIGFDEVFYKGTHEPIISEEIYNQVRRKANNKNK